MLFSDKLNVEMLKNLRPSIMVSYNYSHIIPENIIGFMQGKIINLHISYLPWNRGSDPNIWSFIDNTIKGVTIHEIDAGLDTGNIIVQEAVKIDASETLASSYCLLHKKIVQIFQENWDNIKNNRMIGYKQDGVGSYHTKADLKVFLENRKIYYNMSIREFKKYCRR